MRNQFSFAVVLCFMICCLPVTSFSSLIGRDLYSVGDGLITYDTESNLEWLDLSMTTGMSYQELQNLGCESGCSDTSGGLADWLWADRSTLAILKEHAGIGADEVDHLDQASITNAHNFIDLVGPTNVILAQDINNGLEVIGTNDFALGFVADTYFETPMYSIGETCVGVPFGGSVCYPTLIPTGEIGRYGYGWGVNAGFGLDVTIVGLSAGMVGTLQTMQISEIYERSGSKEFNANYDENNPNVGAWFYREADISTGVPIDPIPEPATMLLFGTGLIGLVGSRLRKKKK